MRLVRPLAMSDVANSKNTPERINLEQSVNLWQKTGWDWTLAR